jgi:amino acid adenylation domain-containing protein
MLHDGFLRSCALFPGRPALDVAGRVLNYIELHRSASSIAATLMRCDSARSSKPVAVLAHRSVTAFVGALGALMSGRAVVPLNPMLPIRRTRMMIEETGVGAIVVDSLGQTQISELIAGLEQPLVVILPEAKDAADFSGRRANHRFLLAADLESSELWEAPPIDRNSVAYFFFTSGSTGIPKCVPVLHRNAVHFVEMSVSRYSFNEHDRFLQFHDQIFDSILANVFVCWRAGACSCCPSVKELVNLDHYIRKKELTVLSMVPSTGYLMERLRTLKPNRYPKLRFIRVGGEALTVRLAMAWAEAAPDAVIENLYGPTETTVAVCGYRWCSDTSPPECENGIVPIGYAHPGSDLLILNENLVEVADGGVGELLIGGAQVTPGYWRKPELSRESFVMLPGRAGHYYRTGDHVRRHSPDGPIHFLGRADNQIKIHGVRIELAEVEVALREAAATDNAVALGWPRTSTGALGIIAFLDRPDADVASIMAELKLRLPNVMVPREIRLLPSFPLNAADKVDREALLEMLRLKS